MPLVDPIKDDGRLATLCRPCIGAWKTPAKAGPVGGVGYRAVNFTTRLCPVSVT